MNLTFFNLIRRIPIFLSDDSFILYRISLNGFRVSIPIIFHVHFPDKFEILNSKLSPAHIRKHILFSLKNEHLYNNRHPNPPDLL